MLEDRSYMREPRYRTAWSITTILLVTNVVCFALQYILQSRGIFEVDKYFALHLWGIEHGYFWQVITFQFLHANFSHILFNSIGLYFFGRAMEEALGGRNFLKLYLLSGVIGGLLQLSLAFFLPHWFSGAVMGASAGVFGLIAAFATRAPEQPITLLLFFILPVTFTAKVLLYIEATIALLGLIPGLGVFGSNVAHAAHLGGMITGVCFIKWLSRSGRSVVVWRPFRRSIPRGRAFAKTGPQREPWKPKVVQPELPPEEFIAQEVDPILDKISQHGIQSLTDRERQILEAARKKMAKR